MNYKKLLLALTGTSLLTTVAFAQVELTITGSTAFRSVAQDRVPALFDAGYTTTLSNSNIRTYSGTMSAAIPALGSTPVTVRMSFSGSAAGMQAVKNSTPVGTADPVTSANNNKVPDVAFSDVFPGSANPPIATSAFASRTNVGVVPFVFVKSGGATLVGITNITRDQAILAMTAGGFMPATYLGGSNSTAVYMVGRDSGSGTRISVEKDINFRGTPFLFAKDSGNNWVTTNGFSSGSSVASTVLTNSDAIGYLGLADYKTIADPTNATPSVALSYNGVAYSTTNVVSGKYALWGYENFVTRIGLSSPQQSVRDALVAAINNANYQKTNTVYNVSFESLNDMQVERGTDGGTITSLTF